MIIRKLRLQRSWSQEQLAEFSGLSVRTIQRIERGQQPGLESLKSLAAVFEVDISELKPESEIDSANCIDASEDEQEAIEQVKELKDFYTHLAGYIAAILFMLCLNLLTNPEEMWVWKVAGGWGIGLALHALSMIDSPHLFSPNWEKRQVAKRLGRKL